MDDDALKHDGLSYENAVVVNSVEAEYDWLEIHYPGFELIEQGVHLHEGKPYDVVAIFPMDEGEVSIHFDISAFYKMD